MCRLMSHGLWAGLFAACLLLAAAPLVGAPDRPQAVSPGTAVTPSRLADSCPTFSWSGVPGATSYELALYRVAGRGELETVFEVQVPGDARAWTPSASHCPASDASYAWAVRAIGEEGNGAWSEALLFDTAGTPSDDEVRRALRVLRRYTEMVNDPGNEPAPVASAEADPGESVERFRRGELRPSLEAIRRDLQQEARQADARTTAPAPRAVTPPPAFSLSIDGDFYLGGYVFRNGDPFIHAQGQRNTAMGRNALIKSTPDYPYPGDGTNNSAFGDSALLNNTTGSRNTGLGDRALLKNDTGDQNTAIGYKTMFNNLSGSRNTAVGNFALFANTTGSRNIAIGNQALDSSMAAHGNTAVGEMALTYNDSGVTNTAVGYHAGSAWTTGNHNVALGRGAYGVAGEGNTIRIGGSGFQNRTFIEGIRGASSDDGVYGFDEPVCTDQYDQLGPCTPSSRRFKQAISTMGDTAALVRALRPVTFRFRPKEGQEIEPPLQYGLIAEEVGEVLPTLVSYDDEGRPYTVRYSLLTPLLLNEIQRLRAELEELHTVEDEVAELRRRLEALAEKRRVRSPSSR